MRSNFWLEQMYARYANSFIVFFVLKEVFYVLYMHISPY